MLTLDQPQTHVAIDSSRELRRKAVQHRIRIVKMTHNAKCGHPGGSMGAADVLTVLYNRFLRHNPKSPKWADRDRFVLSNGHICPILYSILADHGYFPAEWLDTFRSLGSQLQGHPDLNKTPGVEMCAGSLGQGFATALGMALAARIERSSRRVYVMIGDGEAQEGSVWETAMSAPHFGVDNLCAIMDLNGQQIDGPTEKIMNHNRPTARMSDKWRAFGWHVVEIDGHDFGQIDQAFREAAATKGKPTMILARTVMGSGVSFMEHNFKWHGVAPNDAEAEQALKELNATLAELNED